MSQLIAKAEKLTKVYKLFAEEIAAVNNVDLEISSGEFVSIMGPSGSGKTTLLDMIGCLDGITSGRLEILGKDVSTMAEHRLVNIRRGKILKISSLLYILPAFIKKHKNQSNSWKRLAWDTGSTIYRNNCRVGRNKGWRLPEH